MNPQYIILHHSLTKDSETVSWGAIRRYHTQDMGWKDIGYHYGIELIGDYNEILVGRLMNQNGAHCKEQSMNSKSLGVCFVGNFDEEKPNSTIWEKGVRLVSSLCEILRISTDNIYGHRDFASYKSCPGKLFNIEKFKRDVRKNL